MQKVVDFLERYCQWIAVGVGALFFLFALSQYLPVVTTPVTAQLGSETVTPGEIDTEIVQSVADPLETAMNDPNPIAIKVPNYVTRVTDLANTPPKVAPLSPSMALVRKVELPELPWEKGTQIEQNVGTAIVLPTLPAAVLDPAPYSGFAQVNPAAAQPGAVAPAPNAAGNLDVIWVRVPFSISMGQIDREFRAANVPGALARTNFVRVELIRQRQLPDDSWGPEETVKPIDTVALQTVPAGGNPLQLLQFNEWAIQNQQAIVQPPFYTLVAGDNPLTEPLNPEDEAAAQAAAFDPETYTGPLDKLTPEQKKLVQEARQRKAKEAQEARRAAGAGNRGNQGGGGMPTGGGQRGGGGRGGPPGGGGFSSPANSPSQDILFQYRPMAPGGGPPGGPPPGYPGAEGPGYPGGYPGDGGMNQGVPGLINLPPLANQQFIPVAGMPDVMGHAFDMSAKPGAVYRYRIRYSLMNPLFNANAAGVGANVAAVYEIFGEDKTKWTEAVTVKSNNYIYLQAVPTAGANLVRFTLFRWQNGKWNRSNQTFSPGESIGKLEGDVDYRSNYTLVEVRRDSTSDRAYALLMADNGSVEKRDFDLDSATKQFKDLNLAIDGPIVPAAPAGGREGMPGGGMPGGGMPGGGYPGGGMPGGGYPGRP